MRPRLVVAVLALACVLSSAAVASAEWFGDLYVGTTFTRSHDVKIDDAAAGRGAVLDIEFDTALSGGLRFGRYFDALPFLGVAVDVFQFYPYIGPQSAQFEGCFVVGGCGSRQGGLGSFEVETTAISLDLMLRLPLFKTADAPGGFVQPYIGAGVPVFVTTVTPRHTRFFRQHDSDTDVTIGYKGIAGVAVQFSKSLAVFAEYRFNHVDVDVELRSSTAVRSTLRTDLNSHSTLIGISARW